MGASSCWTPTLCVDCGRPPSERTACDSIEPPTVVRRCSNAVHDRADDCDGLAARWRLDWEEIAKAAGERPDIMVTSLRGRIVNMRAELSAAREERDAMAERMGWTVEDNAKKAVALADLRAERDHLADERDELCRLLHVPEGSVRLPDVMRAVVAERDGLVEALEDAAGYIEDHCGALSGLLRDAERLSDDAYHDPDIERLTRISAALAWPEEAEEHGATTAPADDEPSERIEDAK
jgi:hypothetical protein